MGELGRRQTNEKRVKLKCQRCIESDETRAVVGALEKPQQAQTQSFQEETNLKNSTCVSYTGHPTDECCFLVGGRGDLNKLKNLEGKPRWQRVWRPDPARELNTARMLGLRNSRERWPLNPEQGWLSDGGYWRTVNLPRNRGRKERFSVQPLQKLGAWWERARWTKCWGSLRAQLNPGKVC